MHEDQMTNNFRDAMIFYGFHSKYHNYFRIVYVRVSFGKFVFVAQSIADNTDIKLHLYIYKKNLSRITQIKYE